MGEMKRTVLAAICVALALTTACSKNPRRPEPRRIAYDCYDYWPYVHYGRYDCWDRVWYGPAYYYYPYRTYYYPATPTGARPDPGARPGEPVRRARERLPLPDRDRDDGLAPPRLPSPDVPVLP
jgi:hypothetical protein